MNKQKIIDECGRGFFFGLINNPSRQWYYSEFENAEVFVNDGTIVGWGVHKDSEDCVRYVNSSAHLHFLDIDDNESDYPIWYGSVISTEYNGLIDPPTDSFTDLKNLAVSAEIDITFTSDGDIHLFNTHTERQLTVGDIEAAREFLKERIRYIEVESELGDWV